MVETLKYSLTPSGANIYTEHEKALEDDIGRKRRSKKKGPTTKVMMIRAIEINWWAWDDDPSAGDEQALQITTNSESGMVEISDKDCFFKKQLIITQTIGAGEGNGLGALERPKRYIINKPYIKKTMWIATDATAVAASSAAMHVELQFTYKYLSDWQMQRMISRKV